MAVCNLPKVKARVRFPLPALNDRILIMEIGFVYAISAAVIWGVLYAISEKVLHSTTPMTILFINSIITVLIMSVLTFFGLTSFKEVFSSSRANLLLIFIAAILVVLANFLILASIKSLNASMASIIEISYPIFVVLFSYIFFRAVPNVYFFIGALLIFIGSFVIIKFA